MEIAHFLLSKVEVQFFRTFSFAGFSLLPFMSPYTQSLEYQLRAWA